MRTFSFRPSLTIRGRKFKGLRGWAGKPFHPPLTDIPVAAYVFAAVFDVISRIGGTDHAWGRDFYRAWTMVTVTVIVLVECAVRAGDWDAQVVPTLPLVMSLVIALLVSVGATIGGTLVYDYGFNVETAGDSPVWHVSETDVLPGQK
jgi:uncharacterized membrane protein